MNVFVVSISDISPENIYLMDPKKNILMDGTFSKMMYVHPSFSMNGIYIYMPIHVQKIENYSFSKLMPDPVKQTISFLLEKHSDFISTLETLENKILENYVPLDPNLPKISVISQTMKSGYFRIFRESNKKTGEFILKISGIWENTKGYGLSYKIVETC